jgi:hypothetical protein
LSHAEIVHLLRLTGQGRLDSRSPAPFAGTASRSPWCSRRDGFRIPGINGEAERDGARAGEMIAFNGEGPEEAVIQRAAPGVVRAGV